MTRATEDQRAEALRLYVEVGAGEAARRTGIKRTTISQWARRANLTRDMGAGIRAMRQAKAERWEVQRLTAADEIGHVAAIMRLHIVKAAEEDNAQMLRAAAFAHGDLMDKAMRVADGTLPLPRPEIPAQERDPTEPTLQTLVAEARQAALRIVNP